MTRTVELLHRVRAIMNQLDTEDDPGLRADLIEEGWEIADLDSTCDAEWRAFR